jgi:hypothetical protein
MMNQKKINDLKFGDKQEKNLINTIQQEFKTVLSKTKNFNTFDYENRKEKILIELKSRRINKNKYTDTLIGYNKVKSGLDKIKEGYRIIFIFSFIDNLCYYELSKEINISWIRKGGRTDRGKDEIKEYYYIPINKLIDFENKILPSYIELSITPSTSMVEPTDKPLSYTQRLIKSFERIDKDNFNMDDIKKQIEAFSNEEYENKKKNIGEMPFGKYKFKKVEDIAKFDKPYLKWLMKQDMMSKYIDLKNEIIKFV